MDESTEQAVVQARSSTTAGERWMQIEAIVALCTITLAYFSLIGCLLDFTWCTASAFPGRLGKGNLADHPSGQFVFESIYWQPTWAFLVAGLATRGAMRLVREISCCRFSSNSVANYASKSIRSAILTTLGFLLPNGVLLLSLEGQSRRLLWGDLTGAVFGSFAVDFDFFGSGFPMNPSSFYLTTSLALAAFLFLLASFGKRIQKHHILTCLMAAPTGFFPFILYRAHFHELLGESKSTRFETPLQAMAFLLLIIPPSLFVLEECWIKARRQKRAALEGCP